MKRYQTYNSVDSPLIGSIPQGWRYLPLKYIARFYTGNSLNDAEKELFSGEDDESRPYIATKDISASDQSADYNNGINIPLTEESYKVAPRESFLICIEGGSAGRKMTYLSQDVCFVNKLCCVDALENKKYLFYAFQSTPFQIDFKHSLQGLIGGVSISKLADMRFAIPSLPEQQKIVAFLDYKTGKIDHLVEMLNTRIDDLKKYRQSVISETVTRGLDKTAKMKDSGIEWIGETPNHWRVQKLKFMCSKIADGTHFSPKLQEIGMPYITAADVHGRGLDYEAACKISVEDYSKLCKAGCRPEKGDVLIVKDGATTGRVGLKNDDVDCVLLSSVAMLKVFPTSDSEFLMYLMMSNVIHEQISLSVAGSAMTRITLSKLAEFIGVVPPLVEQQSIAKFLDGKISRIDDCVNAFESRIQDLQKYRASLITEAVTGQIDVRDWKAPVE